MGKVRVLLRHHQDGDRSVGGVGPGAADHQGSVHEAGHRLDLLESPVERPGGFHLGDGVFAREQHREFDHYRGRANPFPDAADQVGERALPGGFPVPVRRRAQRREKIRRLDEGRGDIAVQIEAGRDRHSLSHVRLDRGDQVALAIADRLDLHRAVEAEVDAVHRQRPLQSLQQLLLECLVSGALHQAVGRGAGGQSRRKLDSLLAPAVPERAGDDFVSPADVELSQARGEGGKGIGLVTDAADGDPHKVSCG